MCLVTFIHPQICKHFVQGWEILTVEFLEREWKEKMGDWNKQQKSKKF